MNTIKTFFKNLCASGTNLVGVCGVAAGQSMFDGYCFPMNAAQIAAYPVLTLNIPGWGEVDWDSTYQYADLQFDLFLRSEFSFFSFLQIADTCPLVRSNSPKSALNSLWEGAGVANTYCMGIQALAPGSGSGIIIGDVLMQKFHIFFDRYVLHSLS